MLLTPGSPGWYVMMAGALIMLAAVYTLHAWAVYRKAWEQPGSPEPAVLVRSGLLKTAFMFGLISGACYLLNRDVGGALLMGAFPGLATAIEAAAEIVAHARKRRPPTAPMGREREPGAAS